MIGLCVDSNAQLPPELAERYGIEVVPLRVDVGGIVFHEGVDLDADRFYDFWAAGHVPAVATSQPSPGDFADTYRRLVQGGATEILSIHVTASMSGTLNAARLAAELVEVPVRLVDSATAAASSSEAPAAIASPAVQAQQLMPKLAVAEATAGELGTVFVVGVPTLIDRSGRAEGLDVAAAASDGVPVLAMSRGDLEVLGTVTTVDDAIDAMVAYAHGWPASRAGRRVAVGTSDASSAPTARAITERLVADPGVVEVVQYRIGPSVGAHTGPGTVGLFVF